MGADVALPPHSALVALTGVAALAAVWATAALTGPGHWFDDAVLARVRRAPARPAHPPGRRGRHHRGPRALPAAHPPAGVVAVRNGRLRQAALIPVVLAGRERDHPAAQAGAGARPLRGRCSADSQIGAASWPSGHSTAAMALALCAVLVARAALAAVAAALGGAYAVAVGFAVVLLGWHYPSDVLGGYLMAGTWTALGLARPASRRRCAGPRATGREAAVRLRARARAHRAAGGRRASLIAAAAVLARPAAAATFADEHTRPWSGRRGDRALGGALVCGAGGRAAPLAPSRRRARAPRAAPRRRVRRAAEDEEQVGEAVEVAHDLGVDLLAAGDRARRSARRQTVRQTCSCAAAGRAAGDHERLQRRERGVDLVAALLQPRGLLGRDAQALAVAARAGPRRRRRRRRGRSGPGAATRRSPRGGRRGASATPSWALSSSTVPYASIRACVLGTRLMSPRCVSPPSPSRV